MLPCAAGNGVPAHAGMDASGYVDGSCSIMTGDTWTFWPRVQHMTGSNQSAGGRSKIRTIPIDAVDEHCSCWCHCCPCLPLPPHTCHHWNPCPRNCSSFIISTSCCQSHHLLWAICLPLWAQYQPYPLNFISLSTQWHVYQAVKSIFNP